MNSSRKPPRSITPEDFFNEWLPAELARLGLTKTLPEMLVRVELTGDGGGRWDLALAGGQLAVSAPQPAHKPLVHLRLSVTDWRALVVGEEGAVELAPATATPTDFLFVDRASQQLLATLRGTFHFEVTGYHDRTWLLALGIGGASPEDPPLATLTTDATTYAAILARKLSPPEAYMSGKIKISGDVGRGMQVGLALLPKL